MTRMVLALIFTGIIALFIPSCLSADVLLIEEVRQSGRLEVPDNGVTSRDVRARFGDPVKVHNPIGDPPITRWEYGQWSVYFEHDVVLFTVLHKGAVIDKKTE